MRCRASVLLIAIASASAFAGCTNPDAPAGHDSSTAAPVNAGEPNPPPAPSPQAQAPFGVQRTPQTALASYATQYTNWSYRTLTQDQQALARSAVGAARLSEQQAAAQTRNDKAIARGQVWNRGQIISIAPDLGAPGTWVVVTREQTGGNTEYEGLPASYHVTLAKLAAVPGGYAVEQWVPQS
jgi:hypothetical protein